MRPGQVLRAAPAPSRCHGNCNQGRNCTCTATTTPPAPASSAAADAILYAIAKQVPDMARGFLIETSYGGISIESGPGAERIRAAVEKLLQAELKKLGAA